MSLLTAVLVLSLPGCSNSASAANVQTPAIKSEGDAKRVLVVANGGNASSMRIASYYLMKRKISRDQLITLKTSAEDNIPLDRYRSEIEAPIKAALAKTKGIDFIVLTKGVPLRILDEGGYSVDATLASMELNFAPIGQTPGKFGINEEENAAIKRCMSPYFGAKEPFSHAKYGMYLVNRLTGYTVEDVYKMIDNSINAKPSQGPILIDTQPKFGSGGYKEMEDTMREAHTKLKAKGLNIMFDTKEEFSDGEGKSLAGYCSWGSNDANYDSNAYHRLAFVPGAVAETFVSTSGRTFESATEGQSLIADLIHQGVTGVKGYVSEPFTFALCRPAILFDRYTEGFNLAESFYAASPVVKWKDVVIGDPLCRPYKK